mgnify:CR=1 FL=1
MGDWKMKIDVSDLWSKYSDEELEDIEKFEEVRNGIVEILRGKNKDIEKIWEEEVAYEFESIVDDLENSDNLNEFNDYWNTLYDWADSYRVWINTVK